MIIEPNLLEIKDNSELDKHITDITSLKSVTIDTETTGLDPISNKPILFQIGNDKIQYVIHWYQTNLEPLRKYLESKEPTKIFQTHKFDYKFIKQHTGIEIDENIFDTDLAEQIIMGGSNRLYQQGGSNLAALSKKYLNVILDKTTRTEFVNWNPRRGLTQKQLEYAALDIITPFKIRSIQQPILKKEGLEFVSKLEFAVSSVLGDMELNGFFLDKQMWSGLADKVIRNLEVATENLDRIFAPHTNVDLFGKPTINYSSHPQLLAALQSMGLKIKDTSAKTIKDNKDRFEVLRVLEDYREWEKAESTYGYSMLEKVHKITNRIHPSFGQIKSTGRTSCRQPNLQNIISEGSDNLNFREPFRVQNPDDDMLTSDYSGCEIRVLAEISQDPYLVEAFQEELLTGIETDPHSRVATKMFKVEVSKTVNADKRKKMKNMQFGLIYGMGVKKLAAGLGTSIEEAKKLMAQYFKEMPGVAKYLEASAQQAIEEGYSVTLSGRKRYYDLPAMQDLVTELGYKEGKDKYDATVAHIERCGTNTPIQGTNGDITKLALVKLRKNIKENKRKIKIVNTVHDEIVFEGKIREEGFEPIANTLMLEAEAYFLKSIPPRVDSHLAKCWEK